tara:strand:+ start:1279 stop:1542 length:264 start_codon:yes stop_codon:yes gene_type:complete
MILSPDVCPVKNLINLFQTEASVMRSVSLPSTEKENPKKKMANRNKKNLEKMKRFSVDKDDYYARMNSKKLEREIREKRILKKSKNL